MSLLRQRIAVALRVGSEISSSRVLIATAWETLDKSERTCSAGGAANGHRAMVRHLCDALTTTAAEYTDKHRDATADISDADRVKIQHDDDDTIHNNTQEDYCCYGSADDRTCDEELCLLLFAHRPLFPLRCLMDCVTCAHALFRFRLAVLRQQTDCHYPRRAADSLDLRWLAGSEDAYATTTTHDEAEDLFASFGSELLYTLLTLRDDMDAAHDHSPEAGHPSCKTRYNHQPELLSISLLISAVLRGIRPYVFRTRQSQKNGADELHCATHPQLMEWVSAHLGADQGGGWLTMHAGPHDKDEDEEEEEAQDDMLLAVLAVVNPRRDCLLLLDRTLRDTDCIAAMYATGAVFCSSHTTPDSGAELLEKVRLLLLAAEQQDASPSPPESNDHNHSNRVNNGRMPLTREECQIATDFIYRATRSRMHAREQSEFGRRSM